MTRFLRASLIISLFPSLVLADEHVGPTAEWTVMVFMNAKNSLEQDAIDNFSDIASVGSTKKVNVVVELGRPSVHVTCDAEGWSGVKRFLVQKGDRPVSGPSVVDVSGDPRLSDLGSQEAFADFLEWSIR